MAADGATVSAEELLERVWDEHTDPFTNVVRMTIMTLRRKLGDPPVRRDGDRGRLPDGLMRRTRQRCGGSRRLGPAARPSACV